MYDDCAGSGRTLNIFRIEYATVLAEALGVELVQNCKEEAFTLP